MTHRYALLAAAGAVVFWGGSFIAIKIAVQEISPLAITVLRFGIGIVVLVGTAAARRQLRAPTVRELPSILLLGLMGIPFHQWLQATGLKTAQATTSAWLVATTPVFIAFLGRVLLRERLGIIRICGICLAAVGVLVLLSRGDPRTFWSSQPLRSGDVLVLLSAPNWAFFSVLSRRAVRDRPPASMTLWVASAGWGAAAIAWLATGNPSEALRLSSAGWEAVVFLGVFCSGFAYVFWFDALQKLPAARVGAMLYLEPLVTVVTAAVLLGENVTAATVTGAAGIFAGLLLVERRFMTARPAAPGD